jgi:hypothetical protein
LFKILLLSIFTTLSFAQEQFNAFEYSRGIYSKVKELSKLSPEEYVDRISQYREDVDKFISHKKGVCEGNFSTVILNQQGQEKSEYKLSQREQELCYRELKGLQLNYINNLFEAKKRYLNYLHEKRIVNLNKARETSLKQLQAMFDKKILKKKPKSNKRRTKKK